MPYAPWRPYTPQKGRAAWESWDRPYTPPKAPAPTPAPYFVSAPLGISPEPPGAKAGRRARGAGAGDWSAAIAQAIAGKELDRLTASVRDLLGNIADAINYRKAALDAYRRARAELAAATARFGPVSMVLPMGGTTPNHVVLPFVTAERAAATAVRTLARVAVMFSKLGLVYGKVEEGFRRAGLDTDAGAVSSLTTQLMRFVNDTPGMASDVPLYMDTVRSLNSAFGAELSAWGVSVGAYDDPRWMQAFVKAADKVVPLPQGADAGMGNPLPVLILAIIVVVAGVIAAIGVLKSLSVISETLNSKAIAAKDLLERRLGERAKLEAELRNKGAPESEIRTRLDTFDAGTEAAVKLLPDPTSLFGALGLEKILVPAGVVVAGYFGLKAAGAF